MISVLLRQSMHELASAYEEACAEYGEDSERALLIADALEFMRRWMRRYSDHLSNTITQLQREAGCGAPP